MDNWDPMEEDFNSVAFNSYDRGQGVAVPIDHLPSWRKRVSYATNQTVTLHISNIPVEVKESGLQHLFNNYGEVLRVYRSHPKEGKCFGFVDYATLKEAELAIREVDGKPPLRLRVSFSMSKQDKHDQNKLKQEEMGNYLKMTLEANDKQGLSRKKLEYWGRGSSIDSFRRQTNFSDTQRPYPIKGVGRGEPLRSMYDYGLTDNEQLHRFRITATNEGREISYLGEDMDDRQYTSGGCNIRHAKSDSSQYVVEHSSCISNSIQVSSHHYGKAVGRGIDFHHVHQHRGELPLPNSYCCDQDDSIHMKTLLPHFNDKETISRRNELLHTSLTKNQQTFGCTRPVLRRPYPTNLSGPGCIGQQSTSNIDDLAMSRSNKELSNSYIDGSNNGLVPFPRCINPHSIDSNDQLLPTPQWKGHLPFDQKARSVISNDKFIPTAQWRNHLQFGQNAFSFNPNEGLLPTSQWRGHLPFEGNGVLPLPSQAYSNHNIKAYQKNEPLQATTNTDRFVIGREKMKSSMGTNVSETSSEIAAGEKVIGGPCENCRMFGTSCCSACKVWYCSRDCQIKHWPVHQKSCKCVNNTNNNEQSAVASKKDKSGFQRNQDECAQKNNGLNATIVNNQGDQQKKQNKQEKKINEMKPKVQSNNSKKNGNEYMKSSSPFKNVFDSNKENVESSRDLLSDSKSMQKISRPDNKMQQNKVESSRDLSSDSKSMQKISRPDNKMRQNKMPDASQQQASQFLRIEKQVELKYETLDTTFVMIKVCSGFSPDDIWLHKVPEAEVNIEKLSKTLKECCEKAPSHYPKVGEIYGAFYIVDKSWCRVKVNEVRGKDCTTYFVDFGNTEVTPISNIRRLPNECLLLPAQAIACKLDGIQPVEDKWSCNAIKLLSSFLRNGPLKARTVTGLDEGKYGIELIDIKGNNISEILIKSGYAKNFKTEKLMNKCSSITNLHQLNPKDASQETKPEDNKHETVDSIQSSNSKSMKHTTLIPSLLSNFHAGEQVALVIAFTAQDDNIDFWAHPMLDETYKIMEKLLKLNDHQSPNKNTAFCATVGDVVVAQSVSDGGWYRAYILCVRPNSYYVRYIDYGNEEQVTTIASLPSEYKSVASIAIHCFVSGTLSSEKKIIFKNHIVDGGSVSAKIISTNENKICMDLINPENDSLVLCSLNVYAWDYGIAISSDASINLPSIMPFKKEQLSQNNSEQRIIKKNFAEGSNKISVPAIPYLVGNLPQHSEVMLAIVFAPDSETDFWAHPVIDETTQIMEKLMKLNELANDVKNNFCPNPGDAIVAQSIIDSYWYRAYVLRTERNTYYVRYIDYGNEENVTKVVPLMPEYASLPSLTMHCSIGENLSSINKSIFKKQLNTGAVTVKITSTHKDKMQMELINPENKSMIGALIAHPWYYNITDYFPDTKLPICEMQIPEKKESGRITPSTIIKEIDLPINNNIICMKSNDEYENSKTLVPDIPSIITNLQNGAEVILEIVYITEDKTDFWAHPAIDEICPIMEQLTKLKDFTNSVEGNFCPSTGEVVIALSAADSSWYRAYILHSNPKSYYVQYIDYGNKEEVTTVLPIPADYALVPTLTMHCLLNGKLSSINESFIKEHVTIGNSVFAKITSVDQNKIEMNLLHPEEKSVICTFVGYPWHQDIKYPPHKIPDLSSPTMEIRTPLKKCSDLSADAAFQKRKEMIFTSPSLITNLQKGSDIRLGVAVLGEDRTHFWAQPLICETGESMEKLMKLEECVKDVKDENFCLHTGDLVVALSIADGCWYRACILGTKNNMRKVRYIDYGNEEEVTRLIPLPLEFALVPSLSIHCILCKSLSLANKQAFEKLICLDSTVTVRITSAEMNKIEMDLLNLDGNSVCALVGYPWHHDIERLISPEILEPVSDLKTAKQPAVLEKSAFPHSQGSSYEHKHLDKRIDQDKERKTVACVIPSIITNLKKDSDITLCVAFIVKDKTDFWAQPLIPETGELMQQLMKLNECVKDVKGENYCPIIGDTVVALSVADGCWYRAYVLQTKSGKYSVRYIDYGNEEEVERVIPLLPEFASIPSLTIHCIVCENLSSANEQLFKKIVSADNTVTVRVTSTDKDKIAMDLLNHNNNSVICTVIGYPWYHDVQTCTALESELVSDSNIIEQPDIPNKLSSLLPHLKESSEHKNSDKKSKDDQDQESKETLASIRLPIITNIQKGSDVILGIAFMVEGKTDFWAQPLISETGEIIEQLMKLSECAREIEEQKFNPTVGDTVVALSVVDGFWYRAFILQINNGKYYVRYIDYGNEEEVARVVPLLPEFASIPSLTIHCMLCENLSSANEQVFKKIVCADSTVTVKVTSSNKNEIMMDLLSPDNNSVVCVLVGYPWHHDIQRCTQSEKLELVSDSKKTEQPGAPNKSISFSPYPNDSSNELKGLNKELQDQKSKETLASINHSIISNIQKDTDITLGVAFMVEGNTDFWAQPLISETGEIMEQLMRLNEYSKDTEEQKFDPLVGDTVVALSVTDGCWYRAYVLQTKSEKYYVRYIDYGNEEEVARVIPLLPEFASIPSLTIHCILHENLSSANEQAFKKIVCADSTVTVKVTSTTKDKIAMDLLNPDSNSVICSLVGYPWYYDIQSCISSEKFEIISDLKMVEEPTVLNKPALFPLHSNDSSNEGKDLDKKSKDDHNQKSKKTEFVPPVPSIFSNLSSGLKVVLAAVVVSENDFWFHIGTDSSCKIMEKLSEFDSYIRRLKDKEYNAKVGDVVIAQSLADGCWYRAYILNTDENKYVVRYIDYGNEERVLLVVPPLLDHVSIPSLIVHCFISEDQCPEKQQLARKHIVADATLLSAKITTVNQNKIEMDLLNKENDVDICKLIGYPWYHGLASVDYSAAKNEDVISTVSNPMLVTEKQELINERINLEEKSIETSASISSSIIKYLLKDSVITLGITFTVEGKTDFWAQPLISETVEIIQQLTMLSKCAEDVKENRSAVGDIVVALSAADSCWYRAYVLQTRNGKYYVKYIDYGNEEEVARVVPLLPEYASIPSLIIHCILNENLLAANEKLFKELVRIDTTVTVKIKSTEEDKIVMDLLNPDDNSVICSLIGCPWHHDVERCVPSETPEITFLKISEQSVDTEKLTYSPLHYKDSSGDYKDLVEISKVEQDVERLNVPSVLNSIENNMDTSIFIVKSDMKKFSAVVGEKEALQAVVEIEADMAKTYEANCKMKSSLAPGDLVAAYSPSELCWRRACILKSLGSSYSVRYIDYGEEEIVAVAHLLEEQHCFIPSPLIFCIVDEVPNDIMIDLKKIIIQDTVVKVRVVDRKEDKLYLQLKIPDEKIFCHLTAYAWNYDLNKNNIYSRHKNALLKEQIAEICDTNDSFNDNAIEINSNTKIYDDDKEPNGKNENLSPSNSCLNGLVINPSEDIKQQDGKDCCPYVLENNNGDIKSNANSFCSISTILKPDREVNLSLIASSGEKFKFWACVGDIETVASVVEMQALIASEEFQEPIKPKTGDIIAAKSTTDGQWYRAYVLINNGHNLQVRYIDYGNEEDVVIYKALNPVHLNLLSPALYCIVEDGSIFTDSSELEKLFVVDNTFSVKVCSASRDEVQFSVIMDDGATMCNLLGLPWYHDLIPLLSDKSNEIGIIEKNVGFCAMYSNKDNPSVSSLDNVDVQIVFIMNFQNLFVQNISQISDVSQLVCDITEYCENLPLNSYEPKIDEIVCVKFNTDGMWYRGHVKSISTTGNFMVHFVDFGNDEEIDSKCIRPLPEHFAAFPAFAIRIALELPSILPTTKVREILQNQIWNVKVINAETASVRLVNHKGLSVLKVLKAEIASDDQANSNQKELANPLTDAFENKVTEDKKTEKFLYSECQIVAFPTSKITVIVTSIIAPDTIFCCLSDDNIIPALESLNNEITIHCTKTECDHFCPEIGELCLAKYSVDGLWYRAVPLLYINKSIQILFVDFGNIEMIELKNTRPMLQKFMELPLQGVHCALSGIASESEWTDDVIQILLSLVPQQKPIKIDVLGKNDSDVYLIDIPGVSAHLKTKCSLSS